MLLRKGYAPLKTHIGDNLRCHPLIGIALIVARESGVQLCLVSPSPFLMGVRLFQTFSRFCIQQHCREHQAPSTHSFPCVATRPQMPRSRIAGLKDELGIGVWDV